jgi:hypothetical protein
MRNRPSAGFALAGVPASGLCLDVPNRQLVERHSDTPIAALWGLFIISKPIQQVVSCCPIAKAQCNDFLPSCKAQSSGWPEYCNTISLTLEQ